jgi:hypothetical protein
VKTIYLVDDKKQDKLLVVSKLKPACHTYKAMTQTTFIRCFSITEILKNLICLTHFYEFFSTDFSDDSSVYRDSLHTLCVFDFSVGNGNLVFCCVMSVLSCFVKVCFVLIVHTQLKKF